MTLAIPIRANSRTMCSCTQPRQAPSRTHRIFCRYKIRSDLHIPQLLQPLHFQSAPVSFRASHLVSADANGGRGRYGTIEGETSGILGAATFAQSFLTSISSGTYASGYHATHLFSILCAILRGRGATLPAGTPLGSALRWLFVLCPLLPHHALANS